VGTETLNTKEQDKDALKYGTCLYYMNATVSKILIIFTNDSVTPSVVMQSFKTEAQR
jgi:hypothetical protein